MRPEAECAAMAAQVSVEAARFGLSANFDVRGDPMGFAAKLAIVSAPRSLLVAACSDPLTLPALSPALSDPEVRP